MTASIPATIMFPALDLKAIQVSSATASIGASLLQSNDVSEQGEHGVLNEIDVSASSGSSNNIIAIDLDDVLCETNKVVAECKSMEL